MLIRLLTALAWLCSLAMIAYTAYYFAVALFGFRRRRPIPEAAPGARFAGPGPRCWSAPSPPGPRGRCWTGP